MKFQWKYGEGPRFTFRDIIGIFVICGILFFISCDKSFVEAFGPVKTFEKPDKEIKINVVIDSEFFDAAGSENAAEKEIAATIKGASEIFEKYFGIRFVICSFVRYDDREKTASVLKFRSDVSDASCDISILFTGKPIKENEVAQGIAILFGSKIIIKERMLNYSTERRQSWLLAHEFGHIFGAKHASGGFMHKYGALYEEDTKWDEFSWRVIILSKNIRFS